MEYSIFEMIYLPFVIVIATQHVQMVSLKIEQKNTRNFNHQVFSFSIETPPSSPDVEVQRW